MANTLLTARRTLLVTGTLLGVAIAAAVMGLSIGTVPIPLREVMTFLTGGQISDEHHTILLSIRLPRVALAFLAGGGLAVAGATLQAILRNPLAEPYILGISSGGALGAVLVLSAGLGAGLLSVPLAAFIGAALVMILVYGIATRFGRIEPTTLLLAGVMVGAFLNALILLIASIFPFEIRNVFIWLMGNLGAASLSSLIVVAPVVILACGGLYVFGRSYNLLAASEESAAQLGVNVETMKRTSYLLASLITGVIVSVSGIIGFVGLIIPHIGRLVFGPDHRLLLPVSFFLGASFLILVDLLARTIISPSEIPVGAMTAIFGAPVFVWLLRRR